MKLKMNMQNDIQKLLSYLLDKVDPYWHTKEDLVDAFNSLSQTKSKRFEPPSLMEVITELKSQNVRHYQEQASKFWNFYESKNWMIGKNKMKNWKAAIKTWGFEKDNLIL